MDSYIDGRWWGGQGNMGNGYSPHSSNSITVPGSLNPTNELKLWQLSLWSWMGPKTFNTDLRKVSWVRYVWIFNTWKHSTPYMMLKMPCLIYLKCFVLMFASSCYITQTRLLCITVSWTVIQNKESKEDCYIHMARLLVLVILTV